MEQHPPTIFIAPDPPPFPAPPRTVDLSPLEFILAILAVIAIPALIYTFFFSIKCPPSPFRRRRSSNSSRFSDDQIAEIHPTPTNKEIVSDLKYQKETHVKDLGIECPVCLSVFADGEEVKQLGICKHSFHASCIDMWLNSHSNCPVCRASVAPPPAKRASSSSSNRNNDVHQGLPDASNLV
ncbi:RING-H2 finger protein ATL33 [Euphorbia lathyris]|uniref:RING-H2 finger protein ATL33 n=1 Tax=Euphorbia lathyris TaxID=212925 RepID=UPI003314271E